MYFVTIIELPPCKINSFHTALFRQVFDGLTVAHVTLHAR